MDKIIHEHLNDELHFITSRSSGPGGQNVNKVNTRVELHFHINNSKFLSDNEKNKISHKLNNRINKDGELILVSQTERSQFKNKEDVIKRFHSLIENALKPTKKRIHTRPTHASRLKRQEDKRIRSVKKMNRQKPEF